MKYADLLLYPILWLVTVFYGAGLFRRGETPADFLCPEQAAMIRAAACLGIILHHLAQRVTGYGAFSKGPVTVFNYAGFLFTALFFFFSGFGLITSYYTKENYLGGFLRRRLPSVLVPFWTVNLLGVLLEYSLYGAQAAGGTAAGILKNISGLTLINGNGWFIVEIVILYLCFYVFFRFIKNEDAALALLCLAVLLLMAYSFSLGHDPKARQMHWFRGEWWYNSTITFAAGLLCARFREKIEGFCRRHYPAVLGLSAVLSAAAFRASVCAVNRWGYYRETELFGGRRAAMITLGSQMAACLACTAFVVLLSMRIAIGNRALKFVSGMSLELFLVHGYFANQIFGNVVMSDFRRFAAVTACSLAGAAAVSQVTRRLVRRTISFLDRVEKYMPEGVRVNDRRSLRSPGRRDDGRAQPGGAPPITLERQNAERRRKKFLRRLGIAAAAGTIACAAAVPVRCLLLEREYAEEREAIRTASAGDEVLWGRFETDPSRIGRERLAWIVIRREDDRVCLLSGEGIAGNYYHQKHEAVAWEESDLRAWLNSEEFMGMFSRREAADVLPVRGSSGADQAGGSAADSSDGDRITLLTAEEAEELFSSDEERQLAVTAAAEARGTNVNRLSKDHLWDMKGYRSSWWWLRGESGRREITAPIVTEDGSIAENVKYVNKPGGAVRPVIWVRCAGPAE